jgi:putative restriction endonuclease
LGRRLFCAAEPGCQQLSRILKADEKVVDTFDPNNVEDARKRTLAEIVQRQGQGQFRSELLTAYDAQCSVSGCTVREVLEAAHIIPYKGAETNNVQNGVLLRADLHTLFDLGLITINAETHCIVISPKLSGTMYAEFEGKKIRLPSSKNNWPSQAALKEHRSWADL